MLDIASDEQRPIYLATNGILNSVTVASPIIVGAMFTVLAPEIVFGVMAVLSGVGAILTWMLRKGRRVGV